MKKSRRKKLALSPGGASMIRLVFDTETGGFNPQKDALLTAAFVVWKDFEIGPALDLKIWDGKSVSPDALRVNGINLEQHRAEAVTPVAAARRLNAFLNENGMPSGGEWVELVGHNAPFDVGFLQALWATDSYLKPYRYRFSVVPRCLWQMSLWMRDAGEFGKLPNLKLGTLCQHFGIPLGENAHGALADATAAAHLYSELLKKLKARSQQFA